MVVKSILNLKKRNLVERSISVVLRLRIKVKTAQKTSIPDQLYLHTLSVNQVTKNDTQASLKVEVVSDHCKNTAFV